MLNIVLTAILIAIGLSILLIMSYCVAQYLKIKAIFRGFIEHEEGKPSNFGILVDSIASSAGRALALEVKTTIMGKLSGISRGEKAVEGAIAQDSLPGGIMSLIQSMPSLNKLVSKNPGLLTLAANALSGLVARTHSGAPGNGSNDLNPKFDL